MSTIPYSSIEGELWKPIPGYDGRYEASNEGRVRRVKGKRSGERLPRLLRTFIADGYVRTVLMCDNGSQYKPGVHVLVAEAFLGPCPEGQEVNHMDLNKFNNRACNLEYLTRLDNLRHARSLKSWSARGEGSGQAKLTEEQVRAIRLDGRPQRVVGKDYGISGVAVCLIRQRKSWKHVEDQLMTYTNNSLDITDKVIRVAATDLDSRMEQAIAEGIPEDGLFLQVIETGKLTVLSTPDSPLGKRLGRDRELMRDLMEEDVED